MYLREEDFGLALHIRYATNPPTKSVIKHTQNVFDELFIFLLDKGFKKLYTTVEDYVQYRYAQHFGFVDEGIIIEFDNNGKQYQLMKVDL